LYLTQTARGENFGITKCVGTQAQNAIAAKLVTKFCGSLQPWANTQETCDLQTFCVQADRKPHGKNLVFNELPRKHQHT